MATLQNANNCSPCAPNDTKVCQGACTAGPLSEPGQCGTECQNCGLWCPKSETTCCMMGFGQLLGLTCVGDAGVYMCDDTLAMQMGWTKCPPLGSSPDAGCP
jgi:hypothetical protein